MEGEVVFFGGLIGWRGRLNSLLCQRFLVDCQAFAIVGNVNTGVVGARAQANTDIVWCSVWFWLQLDGLFWLVAYTHVCSSEIRCEFSYGKFI